MKPMPSVFTNLVIVRVRNFRFALFELANQNAGMCNVMLKFVLWLVESNSANRRFRTLVINTVAENKPPKSLFSVLEQVFVCILFCEWTWEFLQSEPWQVQTIFGAEREMDFIPKCNSFSVVKFVLTEAVPPEPIWQLTRIHRIRNVYEWCVFVKISAKLALS